MALRDLARLVVDTAERGRYVLKPFPEDRRKIDIGDFEADDRAFREITGWLPKISLEDGIRQTLTFYEKEGERYW